MLKLFSHFHEGMKIFKGGSIDTNPLSRVGRFRSWTVNPTQSGELDQVRWSNKRDGPSIQPNRARSTPEMRTPPAGDGRPVTSFGRTLPTFG